MITLGELAGLRRFVQDGCTGKRRYPTFEAADAVRQRLLRAHVHRPAAGELQAYDCRRCGWWHLGHGSDDTWAA